MSHQEKYSKHDEHCVSVNSTPAEVFTYADDHRNFSAHMSESSWMMGGGKMVTETDENKGQKVGSHIKMAGKVFGVELFLDEVIIQHDPPIKKVWETVGNINLLVIDHYQLGFELTPKSDSLEFKVFIDYNLPKSWKTQWLGYFFGGMYAKWCVRQMTNGVRNHFAES